MAGKRIRVYKAPHEYPCLSIIVTDNPRYFAKDTIVLDSVEEAVDRLRNWLTKAMEEK